MFFLMVLVVADQARRARVRISTFSAFFFVVVIGVFSFAHYLFIYLFIYLFSCFLFFVKLLFSLLCI